MSSNNIDPDDGTADETAADRKQECPECGGDVYQERRLRGGTRHEFAAGYCSGWACKDCTWSEPHNTPDDEDRYDDVECPRDDCDNETVKWKVEANGKCDSCRRQDRFEKMARERDRREAQAAE